MANIDFTDQNTLLRFAPGNRPKKKTRALSVMVVIALIVGVLLAIVFFAAQAGRPGDSEFAVGAHISRETRYQAGLARLAGERSQLFAGWQSAETAAARKKALDQAAALLFASIENDIIPLWYGTPYGFNGATALPGAGSISCGHFVTTVLRDAGLKLDRIGLAQEPSELIIQSLVAEESIRRYSHLSGEEFLKAIKTLPPGLFVLGLDKHVGFLDIGPAGVFFIHSTLLAPYSVVREPASSSHSLMTSAYRVLGSLSADRSLILKWLRQEKIATRHGAE
jgi:hypothetical protein